MSDKKRKSHNEKEENVSKRSKKTPDKSDAKLLLSGKEHEDLKRFLRERASVRHCRVDYVLAHLLELWKLADL